MSRYTFHMDPGHGWLEVPRDHVRAAGIYVSQFSYVSADGKTLYLEEDVDAGRFIRETNHRYQEDVIQHHEGDCFVRGLERFPGGQP